MKKSVNIYRPDGHHFQIVKGEESVEDIMLLNNNAICIIYSYKSESVYSGMPFHFWQERVEKS
jgi:hypothetical protein